MKVSLTSASNKIIEQMMALGYEDPPALVEATLECMAHEEMAESDESPEYIEWLLFGAFPMPFYSSLLLNLPHELCAHLAH